MENTLANVDLGRYRRIVQMFWDPEPVNDVASDQPVWCLGHSYQLSVKGSRNGNLKPNDAEPIHDDEGTIRDPEAPEKTISSPVGEEQDSTPSSFSSSLAYGDPAPDGGWPQEFINDFESRFWMTYRSDFKVIPKSNDPRALSTLSLSMRIKNQLGDQTGFSSDSGWGCMIRSGQSLLANAIALQRFGRGTLRPYTTLSNSYITPKKKTLNGYSSSITTAG